MTKEDESKGPGNQEEKDVDTTKFTPEQAREYYEREHVLPKGWGFPASALPPDFLDIKREGEFGLPTIISPGQANIRNRVREEREQGGKRRRTFGDPIDRSGPKASQWPYTGGQQPPTPPNGDKPKGGK